VFGLGRVPEATEQGDETLNPAQDNLISSEENKDGPSIQFRIEIVNISFR
jgi:hypothetical protein